MLAWKTLLTGTLSASRAIPSPQKTRFPNSALNSLTCGLFGFVAFDVDVLLQWNVASIRAPSHLALFGALLQPGRVAEPEILVVPPAPARPPPRDRWADLQQLCVRPGWATLHDFVRVFGLGGRQGLKSAAGKVSKRLRDSEFTVDDYTHGIGRPLKVGRLMDLKRCYAALQ